MGALILREDEGLIPRDVFITPQLFEVRHEISLPAHSVLLHKPEDFAAMMAVTDRDFEAWLAALAIGDERAVAWLHYHVRRRRGAAFSPYTDTFTTNGTITAPAGASASDTRIYGASGGGGWQNHAARKGAGGGGGAYVQHTVTISGGDQIARTIGAAGTGAITLGTAGTNGGTTSVSGSATGGFVGTSMQATGGAGGPAIGAGGAGGVASGGTTNTDGGAGSANENTGTGAAGAGASGAPPGGSGASNTINPAGNGGAGSVTASWS